jgi:hypothetical protein
VSAVKRGGPTSAALRRWLSAAVVLMIIGLTLHFAVRGLIADTAWLSLTIAAAVVALIGYYRHQPER